MEEKIIENNLNMVEKCENCVLDYICNAPKEIRCKKIKELDTKCQNQGITIADLEICVIQRDELHAQLLQAKKGNEELKEVQENAKIAFQVLFNETVVKKGGWSANIFAQNMLLRFFGGEKALKEAKKKRKELRETICFGTKEVENMFLHELEIEIKKLKDELNKNYCEYENKIDKLEIEYHEQIEQLKKEKGILKSKRLNMFEKLDIIQENKQLKSERDKYKVTIQEILNCPINDTVYKKCKQALGGE